MWTESRGFGMWIGYPKGVMGPWTTAVPTHLRWVHSPWIMTPKSTFWPGRIDQQEGPSVQDVMGRTRITFRGIWVFSWLFYPYTTSFYPSSTNLYKWFISTPKLVHSLHSLKNQQMKFSLSLLRIILSLKAWRRRFYLGSKIKPPFFKYFGFWYQGMIVFIHGFLPFVVFPNFPFSKLESSIELVFSSLP